MWWTIIKGLGHFWIQTERLKQFYFKIIALQKDWDMHYAGYPNFDSWHSHTCPLACIPRKVLIGPIFKRRSMFLSFRNINCQQRG